jgi:hypothetical protein
VSEVERQRTLVVLVVVPAKKSEWKNCDGSIFAMRFVMQPTLGYFHLLGAPAKREPRQKVQIALSAPEWRKNKS